MNFKITKPLFVVIFVLVSSCSNESKSYLSKINANHNQSDENINCKEGHEQCGDSLSNESNDNLNLVSQSPLIGNFATSGDPGWGTGTWFPNGTQDHWVVDKNNGGMLFVPGCVNAGDGGGCANRTYYEEKLNGKLSQLRIKPGVKISVRLKSRSNLRSDVMTKIHVKSITGAPFRTNMLMSLSIRPGDFSNVLNGFS